jgi:hypothetical protein
MPECMALTYALRISKYIQAFFEELVSRFELHMALESKKASANADRFV